MGYSITVHTSPEKKQKMLDFMEKNYRPWYAVVGEPECPLYSRGVIGDVSYDNSPNAIGFDYGPLSGWEREYIYTIVRWMALRVGIKKSVYRKDVLKERKLSEPVPCYIYDGYQATPIFLAKDYAEAQALPGNQKHYAYDMHGVSFAEDVTTAVWACSKLPEDEQYKFVQELNDLPKCESDDDKSRQKHLDSMNAVFLKYFRTSIEQRLDAFRAELQRLDVLWNAL